MIHHHSAAINTWPHRIKSASKWIRRNLVGSSATTLCISQDAQIDASEASSVAVLPNNPRYPRSLSLIPSRDESCHPKRDFCQLGSPIGLVPWSFDEPVPNWDANGAGVRRGGRKRGDANTGGEAFNAANCRAGSSEGSSGRR